MNNISLFEKIYNGEIEARVVYKDEHCICFYDISPQAPVHVLLTPRKRICRINELKSEDNGLLAHLMGCIPTITEKLSIAKTGYRVVINNGDDGGETVPHLHLHILGGRQLSWPPG